MIKKEELRIKTKDLLSLGGGDFFLGLLAFSAWSEKEG
jgi:hypothetical protein